MCRRSPLSPDHSENSLNPLQLKAAITAMPKLTEKKRTMDMHMNIATGLLQEIKAREIDTFFAAEDNILKQVGSRISSHATYLFADKGTST